MMRTKVRSTRLSGCASVLTAIFSDSVPDRLEPKGPPLPSWPSCYCCVPYISRLPLALSIKISIGCGLLLVLVNYVTLRLRTTNSSFITVAY